MDINIDVVLRKEFFQFMWAIIKKLSRDELENLPCMKDAMNQAKKQAQEYCEKLNEKYGNLNLKSFVVVSLGFERLIWDSF